MGVLQEKKGAGNNGLLRENLKKTQRGKKLRFTGTMQMLPIHKQKSRKEYIENQKYRGSGTSTWWS